MVWGQSLGATFDPDAKTAIQLNFVNGNPSIIVKWDASEMDSTAQAEHGFTKGELNDLLVWEIMGTSQSWTMVPVRSQMNMDQPAQQLLSRYLDFRGNVAGLYYGNPRARRWCIWLDMAAWNGEYEKMPTVNSRKAIGAMMMQEFLLHRQKYPSIEMPQSLSPDGAEDNLAAHLRQWVQEHPLTLAEDQALRDAVKTFAAANALNVRTSGSVKLPSGLQVALDPEKDKSNAAERGRWVSEHLNALR
jgi:hypothetical protein